MNKSKTVFLLFCLGLFSTANAFAEGRANHYGVKYVRADRSGKGYVVFDKPLAHTPASCGTTHKNHLSFNASTAQGQAILSLALAAHTANKRIQAYGTGNCPDYGTVEAWNWGFVVK